MFLWRPALLTPPGAIAFTRIPYAPHSAASSRVIPRIPAFAAE